MYAIRGHARTTLFSCATRRAAAHHRGYASRAKSLETMEPQNDLARQLAANGTWAAVRGKRKSKNTDKYRVNIVDQKLCDDVIKYIGPTLERHKGCDLIDIFPGVGLWSKTLSDTLQPRSHLLMEPDEEFYKPYLQPLLERPGTKLLPESGIVWEQLNKILNPTELPHQVERRYDPEQKPERNDTLLVSMNLSMYPKRRFRTFDSLASLVLFQLISSIRPGALFQKYGLVRMLIWVGDDEKGSLLPRTVQRRKKTAIEAEISTDWVCEIAGGAEQDRSMAVAGTSQWFRRDNMIDLESTKKTLERMRDAGFVMPPGREPQHVVDYEEFAKLDSGAGFDGRYEIDRPYLAELDRLAVAFAEGQFKKASPQHQRLKSLEYLRNTIMRRSATIVELIREHNTAVNAYLDAGDDKEKLEKATELCQAWSDKVKDHGHRGELMLQRDNMHLLRSNPSILNWDRRYVEPLLAQPDEFFPKTNCALLDIQPKAAASVLRDMGPNSNRGGDIFDLILRSLVQRSTDGVSKSLEIIAAGAGNGIVPHCKSLVDPALGGSPIRGLGEISSRSLNETQLVEITEQWMKWPFRPTYPELVSRTVEDFADEDEEGIMGNMSSEI
jgi:hypothetical protein